MSKGKPQKYPGGLVVRRNASLDPELDEKVIDYANENHITKSEVVTQALEMFFVLVKKNKRSSKNSGR
jgi:hypothetical protein